jgi:hypothetical protein
MTILDVKAKRAAAGISGQPLCQRARIPRNRLSAAERGYILLTPEELRQLDDAIKEIVLTKRRLTQLASDAGLSLSGVRL